MDTALTIFIVSGLGLAGMLLVKYVYLRSGKRFVGAGIRDRADKALGKKLVYAKNVVSHVNRRSFSFIMKEFFMHMAVVFYKIARLFRSTSMTFLDLAKRHAQMRQKSTASFFLKHMSQEKSQDGKKIKVKEEEVSDAGE